MCSGSTCGVVKSVADLKKKRNASPWSEIEPVKMSGEQIYTIDAGTRKGNASSYLSIACIQANPCRLHPPALAIRRLSVLRLAPLRTDSKGRGAKLCDRIGGRLFEPRHVLDTKAAAIQ